MCITHMYYASTTASNYVISFRQQELQTIRGEMKILKAYLSRMIFSMKINLKERKESSSLVIREGSKHLQM